MLVTVHDQGSKATVASLCTHLKTKLKRSSQVRQHALDCSAGHFHPQLGFFAESKVADFDGGTIVFMLQKDVV